MVAEAVLSAMRHVARLAQREQAPRDWPEIDNYRDAVSLSRQNDFLVNRVSGVLVALFRFLA